MMTCPTCDHTMELLTMDTANDVHYSLCPRCGTVVMNEKDLDGRPMSQSFVPKLVERCRDFWRFGLSDGECPTSHLVQGWNRVGIAESINTTERRPK